ncbi:unnamed protein product [Allacma fusca]|uniref:Cytochrome P450 CYP44 n=1 Tax=Allacma fusca TaxID=39272 RepID=A0A8J2PP47_9HEXA|nr:unnamed protein product [Allacma fusca]
MSYFRCGRVTFNFPGKNFAAAIPHCRWVTSKSAQDFTCIPGPVSLPFVGNTYLYKLGIYSVFQYHKVLQTLHAKYGPVVREKIGNRTIVHVFDPDDVKTVHSIDGKMPEVPPLQETTQIYRQKRNLSLGLGNTNGEEWYRLRKAVQQMMMRPKEVSHYLPLQDKVAQDLLKKIEKSLDSNNVISNIENIIAKWSMESSGMVCFEKSLGCLDKNETTADRMIKANRDIFILGGILKFALPIFKYIATPKWKKFLEAEDFFYQKATSYVDETVDEINKLVEAGQLKEDQYSFLAYLLSRKDLSRKDVNIITLSLFADGLSTTSPSLVFNLYCLAKNPDAQDRIYKDIMKNLPEDNRITAEAINNFQLLKSAVKETFRLYPIGTETSRIVGKDTILGNYVIPAGTHVDLNQFVHFRSSKYFHNPEEFLPERWLREAQGTAINSAGMHPYLLIPFGHGTRMCAGRRFAEQDLYTSITRILQNYQLELVDPSYNMEQSYQTLLVPKHPMLLRFIRRKQ